jgi:hypothetical protein
MEKELEKLVFEVRKEEYDSGKSNESDEEVEKLNPVVRRFERVRKLVERYSPLDFDCHYAFVLSTTNDEPRSVKVEIDLKEGKLWKDDMVKEMESL